MKVAEEFNAVAIGMTTNNIPKELLDAGADILSQIILGLIGY